jgi:hypothetical protein
MFPQAKNWGTSGHGYEWFCRNGSQDCGNTDLSKNQRRDGAVDSVIKRCPRILLGKSSSLTKRNSPSPTPKFIEQTD